MRSMIRLGYRVESSSQEIDQISCCKPVVLDPNGLILLSRRPYLSRSRETPGDTTQHKITSSCTSIQRKINTTEHMTQGIIFSCSPDRYKPLGHLCYYQVLGSKITLAYKSTTWYLLVHCETKNPTLSQREKLNILIMYL